MSRLSDDELFTYQEAARFLKVSDAKVREWAAEGAIPIVLVGERHRIWRSALISFCVPAAAAGDLRAYLATTKKGASKPSVSPRASKRNQAVAQGIRRVCLHCNESARTRGLCKKHFNQAYYQVALGRTSWRKLEAKKLALAPGMQRFAENIFRNASG